jgi:hypothetical protein
VEVTAANMLSRDVANYIKKHPLKHPMALSDRIRYLTRGEGLDANDIAQLERKVRWILTVEPKLREERKRKRREDRASTITNGRR